MSRKFFANDPSFGKKSSFPGNINPLEKGPKLESQYTATPRSFRTTDDSPYQGTSPLLPAADYYSNPRMDEHVHSFPSKIKELKELRYEEYALWTIAVGILLLSILKYSS